MQESDEAISMDAGALSHGVIALAALATVVLGLAWGPLIEAAQDATFFFAG
jgi:cytochrome b